MELGLVASRRRAHLSDVRVPLAIVCEPRGRRGRDGVTRLVKQHADAKLIDLLLTLYADAGSCSSLRTADGERPVQRTKA
jgi:hypothetical protein